MFSRFTIDGKRASLLGYGAMRLPAPDGGASGGRSANLISNEIDQPHLNRQVKLMLDAGLTYFDTSPVYCRGAAEGALGTALAASGYDREKYILTTKLSNFSPSTWSLDAAKRMFEKSLKSLRTDYLDNYLLHSIGNGGFGMFSKRYLENGALDWCVRLREERRIRHLGFSFHGDVKAFEWCLDHHDRYRWDLALIQLNYIDWRHAKETNDRNVNAEYLYRRLREKGIPVVVMEPLLGGRLARYNWALANELTPLDPEATLASWALRFCGSFDGVMSVISGMTFDEHISENVATFSPLKPLAKREFEALERAAEAYLHCNAVPCNACNYCMPCPYGLDIPGLLTFRNEYLARGTRARPARETLAAYAKAVPDPLRRAEHCTGCGRCTPHCPQMIDVPREIRAIDAAIDALKDEVLT